jgi:DNA-binding MarR family transcriptional regulator
MLLGVLAIAFVALASTTVARAADPPGMDGGMDPQVVLLADIRSDFNVMEAGSTLPMRVIVVDQHGVPVRGARVEISAAGATLTPAAGGTDADGVFRFRLTAGATPITRATSVVATVTMPGAATGSDRYDLTIARAPPTVQLLPQREAVSIGLGALLVAAFLSTEIGRYGAFNAIIFPLYSRLKKEEVLDHFVRGQIYGYIVSHPGQHYNSMRQDLKVTNGTLSHHLRTLEMMGFIKSYREGVFKRFYPIEVSVPQERGVKLSDLQIQVLEMIRGGAGPTQADIAARLDVTQQTVSYNIRTLSREGAIRMEKDGRNTRYYPPAA